MKLLWTGGRDDDDEPGVGEGGYEVCRGGRCVRRFCVWGVGGGAMTKRDGVARGLSSSVSWNGVGVVAVELSMSISCIAGVWSGWALDSARLVEFNVEFGVSHSGCSCSLLACRLSGGGIFCVVESFL